MRVVTVCASIERFDLVHAFERSFESTAPPEEPAVFVVMGQDDGTAGYLAEKAEGGRPYRVVRSEEVHTFAEAVNNGSKIAFEQFPESDVLMLANDDLVLRPGWYQALADCFEHGADIVGARLVYPKQRTAKPEDAHAIQHAGKFFTLDFFPFHVYRGLPETDERVLKLSFFPCVTFALVAIRREVWEELKGLDESYKGGFEDDDLCLRARENGAVICVHPGFSAVHRESATTGHDDQNKDVQWQHFREQWVDSGRIQGALGIFQGWRQ